MNLWLKAVAPTPALRKWFGHDPARWTRFQERYGEELRKNPQAVDVLRKKATGHTVTLVYGARDTEHNGAVVLKRVLDR